MSNPFAPTYAGDASFSRLLAELGCAMPLHQVKALLLGGVAATGMARMADLMATLWGGEPPTFPDREQLGAFAANFMGLWNLMAAHQDGPPFRLAPTGTISGPSDVVRHVRIRQEEIAGFRRGLDLGKTDPGQLPPDAQRALELLVEGAAFLQKLAELTPAEPEPSPEQMRETAATLAELDAVLEGSIARFLAGQRRARAQALSRQSRPAPPVQSHASPGRNDPCPCGSGRRYKHCHGQV